MYTLCTKTDQIKSRENHFLYFLDGKDYAMHEFEPTKQVFVIAFKIMDCNVLFE